MKSTLLFKLLLIVFITQSITAQEQKHIALLIPKELKEDANAVVRNEDITITIDDFNRYTVQEKRTITILNKFGDNYSDYYHFYDDYENIKKIEAVVYDALGNEIKKFKKRDFTDVSAAGNNLYTDNRVKYIEYTPTSYPYTFEFYFEYTSPSTAAIPVWSPLKGYYISVENSNYKIENPKELPFKSKAYNFDAYDYKKVISDSKINLSAASLKAIPKEKYIPPSDKVFPFFRIALEKFQLVDTPAQVSSWKEFGDWQREKLLAGRTNLPSSTIQQISTLTSGVSSTQEKVKRIYEFMQQKTRYISVQIGIGGWQPTPAEEVDKLGYGDCKGLVNYTKALLDSQDIESYYTIIHLDESKIDLDDELVALQGNHVILTVPIDGENYFLECTNQQVPFNYLGRGTDDRQVLMVTPEGGKLMRTPKFSAEDSFQNTTGTLTITADGNATATAEIKSGGIQYGYKYGLAFQKEKDIDLYYKKSWGYLHNLSIQNKTHSNDKDNIIFTEDITFSTTNYATVVGNDIIFSPNIFNRRASIPVRYDNRNLPLHLAREYKDVDTITIKIPSGYRVEALPKDETIDSAFGLYSIALEKVAQDTIQYTRTIVMNEGTFPKEEYENYREFIRTIVNLDNSKILITKN